MTLKPISAMAVTTVLTSVLGAMAFMGHAQARDGWRPRPNTMIPAITGIETATAVATSTGLAGTTTTMAIAGVAIANTGGDQSRRTLIASRQVCSSPRPSDGVNSPCARPRPLLVEVPLSHVSKPKNRGPAASRSTQTPRLGRGTDRGRIAE